MANNFSFDIVTALPNVLKDEEILFGAQVKATFPDADPLRKFEKYFTMATSIVESDATGNAITTNNKLPSLATASPSPVTVTRADDATAGVVTHNQHAPGEVTVAASGDTYARMRFTIVNGGDSSRQVLPTSAIQVSFYVLGKGQKHSTIGRFPYAAYRLEVRNNTGPTVVQVTD